jgi:hypothetical protein
LCRLSRNGAHDLCLCHIVLREFANDFAISHHDEARTGAQHFFDFGRNKRYADALFGKLEHQFLNFDLGADVDAARGFVQDEILRLGEQPSRKNRLLLVSAERDLIGVSVDAVLMPSSLMYSSANFSASALENGRKKPRMTCSARMMFSRTESSSTIPSCLRSSGKYPMPSFMASFGFAIFAVLPFDQHFAAGDLIRAEDCAHAFASA